LNSEIKNLEKLCGTHQSTIDQLIRLAKDACKDKVYIFNEDLFGLPDGYSYMRKEKRLCRFDGIIWTGTELAATAYVKNKKTKEFDIFIRQYIPLKKFKERV